MHVFVIGLLFLVAPALAVASCRCSSLRRESSAR